MKIDSIEKTLKVAENVHDLLSYGSELELRSSAICTYSYSADYILCCLVLQIT